MNLAGQSTSRPPHRLSPVSCDARPMLMHAHNGCVDHLHSGIVGAGQRTPELGPHAGPTPPDKAVVASRVRTEVVGQVTPWRPGPQDPEDAIEDAAVGLMAVHSSSESS